MEEEEVDPKDYLAMLALGVGIPTARHVWDRDPCAESPGWFCTWCKVPHAHERRDENCPEYPPGVVRLNG